MVAILSEDFYFTGNVRLKTAPNLPAGSIGDAEIEASAGIAATKIQHQYVITEGRNGTAAAETSALHKAHGQVGVIVDAFAGLIAACTGNATVTIDLKKNGTTILSAPIGLDSGDTARVAVDGTVSVTTLAVGDLLEAVVTVNAGTGALGTGLFFGVVVREDAE